MRSSQLQRGLRWATSALRSNILLVTSSVISALLSAACLILSARLLGPERFGLLAALLAALAVATLLSRSIFMASSRLAAQALLKGDELKVRGICAQWLAVALPATAVIGVGSWLLSQPLQRLMNIHEITPIVLSAMILPMLVCTQVVVGALVGLGKTNTFAMLLIVDPLTRTVLTIPLVETFGVSGGLIAFMLSLLTVALIGTVRIGRPNWKASPRAGWLELATASGGATLLIGMVAVAQYLDVPAVRSFAPAFESGLYATAATASGLLFVLGLPICLAAYPRFLSQANNSENMWVQLAAAMSIVVGLGVTACIASVFFAEPLIAIALGPAFVPAAALVPLLLAKATLNVAFFLSASCALAVARDRDVLLASAPLALPLAVILWLQPSVDHVPLFGSVGIALAAVLCLLIVRNATRRPEVPIDA